MKLHFSRQGQGPSLILLHGMLGSHDNFLPIVKLLQASFDIISPDLRNHGRSPQTPLMTYESMAADIVDLLDSLNIPSAHILGHSMGGKAAMRLALDYPKRVDKLIVADVAPKAYGSLLPEIFEALEALNLSALKSRGDADVLLKEKVPDEATRGLLLKNLGRNEDGKFYWKMNLSALSQARIALGAALESKSPFNGPTLFLRGGHSHYLAEEDLTGIRLLFPAAQMATLAGAGHWLHAQQPEAFAKAVADFLRT